MRRRKADHVVMRDGIGVCLHCGAELRWVLPMNVSVWVAMANAFAKQHARCKEQLPLSLKEKRDDLAFDS